VQADVVGGDFFEVMGLRPVLSRLIDMRDDGPNAAGAVVLTGRTVAASIETLSAVGGGLR
jgi:hypothetical protein